MNICIIPARGGSKRIPGKNIKHFKGQPIIAYPIQAAIQSKCFSKVIVSTDSKAIASIASEFGAEIPSIRSAKNSNDNSTLHDVAKECIQTLTLHKTSTYVTIILPTAVFVTSDMLKKFLNSYQNLVYDSFITVVEYEVSPNKALTIDSQGFLSKRYSHKLRQRSQDMEKIYHDAGQVYGFRANEVVHRASLIGKKCKPFVVSKYRSQDIDDIYDWEMAELKYELLRK